MRRFAVAAVLALALGACGGSSAGADEKVSQSCADALAPFLDALKSLDSRLDLGLTYAEYGDKVGDAKVAYDDIDWAEQDEGCVSKVGAVAEKALNNYLSAYTVWNDCMADTACDNDSIKPRLQQEWTSASAAVSLIRDRLPTP